ncbi:MAG: ATP-dependent Clp protease ATP-binding subunit, partial [Anaerolineae bacterium]|nr:ATP-dependent Clp protease ATP-binding subunit [Anaerolineae bacterium]
MTATITSITGHLLLYRLARVILLSATELSQLGDAHLPCGLPALSKGQAIIAVGRIPDELKDTRLVELPTAGLVAGTTYRGQFEERLLGLVDEVKGAGNVILFIDEIHTILRAGAVEGGSLDAGNILKPALARGDLRVIGATTPDEYRQYIAQDAALERRFQPVWVGEPNPIHLVSPLLHRYLGA